MITVTTENFVRAETNRMLIGLQKQGGGVNVWKTLNDVVLAHILRRQRLGDPRSRDSVRRVRIQ